MRDFTASVGSMAHQTHATSSTTDRVRTSSTSIMLAQASPQLIAIIPLSPIGSELHRVANRLSDQVLSVCERNRARRMGAMTSCGTRSLAGRSPWRQAYTPMVDPRSSIRDLIKVPTLSGGRIDLPTSMMQIPHSCTPSLPISVPTRDRQRVRFTSLANLCRLAKVTSSLDRATVAVLHVSARPRRGVPVRVRLGMLAAQTVTKPRHLVKSQEMAATFVTLLV